VSRSNCECQRHEAAIAESKKLFATRGYGERCKLPSGVWGFAPETESNFEHFVPNSVHLGIL